MNEFLNVKMDKVSLSTSYTSNLKIKIIGTVNIHQQFSDKTKGETHESTHAPRFESWK